MPRHTDTGGTAAWGSRRTTRQAAVDSATQNLHRHAAETGRVVRGRVRHEETRRTGSGQFQSRVAGDLRPNRRSRRND
jgi:hypothetical protein